MSKVVKIYTGDNLSGINGKLYEEKLHPIKQVEKAKKDIEGFIDGEMIIFTNSMYILQVFCEHRHNENLKINYKMKTYYNNKEYKFETVFELFSSVFQNLVFSGEKIDYDKILKDAENEKK